ncbi:MAG: prepilin-type N-terminal cleavage/methylation domain-containing protein [Elusimicrobiota bacterium]|jgi:type IV pilus assembly protein PilE|nr:prepilin-type N-terminal cleavage/methylation domain-containing protein [Elusimicrobiota bacterium]
MFFNHKKLKMFFGQPSRGFTLTEVLVVLVVIAILGAIGAPVYIKAIRRSRASDALKVLSLASAKQEAYLLSNEEYATTFSQLSAPVKGLVGGTGATVELGYFEYTLEGECIIASSNNDDYLIYRNFHTNETGCVGAGCDNLQNLIPTETDKNCGAV